MKANYNWDKGAENVFGFTSDYDVECWEFKNNTSEACLFTGEIPAKWDEDFEARYPDGYGNISRLKALHDWILSTKQGSATGGALSGQYEDVDGNIHTHDTAAYRLAKFKTEFADHFNMHYSLIYYVYTFFALMVDQRAKNMFLTYWGNTGKWYPYFYDNDTCFGINNEGGLSFDYYHEDTDQVDGANVYNGQLSTLWVNFRQAFPDKIKETYQDLRSNSVLNYDEIVDQFINKGSNKWSESVYNEDGDFKYISMLRSNNDATNLPQVRGTGEEHLRYFLENRFNYCDSKWYAGEYISKYDPVTGDIVNNFVTLRIYTPVDESGNPRTDLVIPASADITITPYSHMYGGVRYKANGTLIQERLEANETYTFDAPNEVFNDTETAIYGAPQLSSLGDLAPLYLGYIDVGAATKLVELKIGDGTPGYQNNNLYHLAVGTNRLLKKIDIQNCIGFDQALDLTGCPNIEEVYAKGSGITGVDLPDSGYLKILQLPSTITNLTLKNQFYIEDLTIEGYDRLKTITIENCPDIDSLSILDLARNVERVRLTNVDWHYDDASILYELIDRNIGGINENGINTDTMWVDGKCHIEYLTGTEFAEIKKLYPYLEITYTTLESQLVFMRESGQADFVDTIPKIGMDESITVGNGEIKSNPDCFVTELYDLCKTLTSSSDRCIITYYIPITSEDVGDAVPTVQFYNNADECVTFNYQAKDKQEPNNTGVTGQLGIVNKVRFTIAKSSKDVSYAYCQDTGDVLFAGKDTPYYGMKNVNDNPVLCTQTILNGGNGTDPVADGTIETPTKASTAQYHHNFNGWSLTPNGEANPKALLKVEADRVVYAAFTNEIRSYTVNFYSGTKLLYSTVVEYGTDAVYVGSTPTNDSTGDTSDFEFYGWNPAPTNIQGDTNCYAQFNDLREITDDWATIAAACLDGTATSKYGIGAFKELHIGGIELPYEFYNGSAVVYRGEVYCINTGGLLYKFNGLEWVELDKLPVIYTSKYSAVVYNDEIHVMCTYPNTDNHYKYDGVEWSVASTLPHVNNNGSVVVYNNEIHLLGGNNNATSHHKWNGSEWTEVSTLPYQHYEGNAVVYNNEIHIFGGTVNADARVAHYKWNGINWVNVSTLPFWFKRSNAVVYDNEIHLLGGADANMSHSRWNGTEWETASTLPCQYYDGCSIVYNDLIYIIGGNGNKRQFHYFNSETSKWIPFGTTESIPMQVIAHNHDELADGVRKWEYFGKNNIIYAPKTRAVVYNNELHFLGQQHYKWDASVNNSIEVSTMPYSCVDGSAIVYNNEIHILGGGSSDVFTKHYKWDGSSWSEVSTLPYALCGGHKAVVYNGDLYIMSSSATTGNANDRKQFYKWDGSTWTNMGELPCANAAFCFIHNNKIYSSMNGLASEELNSNTATIVIAYYENGEWIPEILAPTDIGGIMQFISYNNEIYCFTTTGHYKWDGEAWVKASSLGDFYSCSNGEFIVYNNEIYAVHGGAGIYLKHIFKWSGPSWESVEEMSINASAMPTTFERNGLLYVASAQLHSWDGETWTTITDMPFGGSRDNRVVLYNDEVYAYKNSNNTSDPYYCKLYKYDWNEWTEVTTMPDAHFLGSMVVYNGCIHVIGGNYIKTHHVWDGSTWTETGCWPVQGLTNNTVVYNDEIYAFAGGWHTTGYYIYNGETWRKADVTIPWDCAISATGVVGGTKCVVHENAIYIHNHHKDNATTGFFKFDGEKWSSVPMPKDYDVAHAAFASFRSKLHLMGGQYSTKKHYTLTNPRATLTFLAGNVLKDDKKWNESSKTYNGVTSLNAGGWPLSDIRTYCNGELLASLPSDLQSAIKVVKKYSDAGYQNQFIVSSDDSIWVLSNTEIGYTSKGVLGQGEPYPVFTNTTSVVAYKVGETTPSTQWFRTTNGGGQFNHVLYMTTHTGGVINATSADKTVGVRPGFCI